MAQSHKSIFLTYKVCRFHSVMWDLSVSLRSVPSINMHSHWESAAIQSQLNQKLESGHKESSFPWSRQIKELDVLWKCSVIHSAPNFSQNLREFSKNMLLNDIATFWHLRHEQQHVTVGLFTRHSHMLSVKTSHGELIKPDSSIYKWQKQQKQGSKPFT